MRTKLKPGESVTFRESVKIRNQEMAVHGEKHSVEIDWDLRIVVINGAIWVPFANVKSAHGGLPTSAPLTQKAKPV